MKAAEMKVFKAALESIRSRLRGDVSAMANVALGHSRSETNGGLSNMPIHMADIGSDAYEQEFTLRRVENEQEVLEEIEEAFERINDETFGVCVSCREAGRPAARSMIPKTRLREIPYARNCVECERKREEHR